MDLSIETIDVDAGAQISGENLDDDFAAERILHGKEDARHAAAAELALERVGGTERLLELGAPVHRPRRRSRGSRCRHGSIVGRVRRCCHRELVDVATSLHRESARAGSHLDIHVY